MTIIVSLLKQNKKTQSYFIEKVYEKWSECNQIDFFKELSLLSNEVVVSTE